MKLLFKKRSFFVILFVSFSTGCFQSEYTSNDIVISNEQKALIRQFATENGYPPSMPLDSFIRYKYDDWPNEADRIDFFLTFPKQDTTPRILVLSDVLTKIGKSLRVHYEPAPYGGTVYQAYIDSIEIKTDSVIVVPALNLSDCNLTHLPAEIGKIRVQKLDLTYNNLADLPLEIMQLLNSPKIYSNTTIYLSDQKKFVYDSLPDTLKNWFENIYNKQNFSTN